MIAPDLHACRIQTLSTSSRFTLREDKQAIQRESSGFCCLPFIILLLGVLTSTGILASQEPHPKQNTSKDSGFVLRQTVRRVRVDVVVTDAQGHSVMGLQASDFRVAEDGKPQSIRQFEYHSDEVAEAALPKRPALPPHTFMNLPTAPEHGPLTVLLYDILNTPIGDRGYARTQMVDFLKRNPGRRIAIFALGDRLSLLQGFTSDTDVLVSAVNRAGSASLKGYRAELENASANQPASPKPSTSSQDVASAPGRETDMAAWEKRSAEMSENETRDYASTLLDKRVDMTLDALTQIGRFAAEFQGRKNLIWYSGSFPADNLPDRTKSLTTLRTGTMLHDYSTRNYTENIRKACDLLNTAQVAVYPVDARGLQTDPFFSGSTLGRDGSSGNGGNFLQKVAGEHGSMDLLGEQTGGRAIYNTNGLEQALETASAEGSSYYSLVYAPTNAKFDGSVRRIAVHLGHAQYHLAYRRSYIADDIASIAPKQSAADQDSASPDQTPDSFDSTAADSQFGAPPSHQLVFAAHVDAIGAPAPATAEQLAALLPYRQQAAKVAHRKFVAPTTPVPMQQYTIGYALLASQLDIPKSANGVYHSDLSMAALAFNEDGETLWGTKTRLKDDIPASKIGSIRENGFQAIQTILVPVETAVIRLVVSDEHSGRIGTMEIRLPLPPDQQQAASAQ